VRRKLLDEGSQEFIAIWKRVVFHLPQGCCRPHCDPVRKNEKLGTVQYQRLQDKYSNASHSVIHLILAVDEGEPSPQNRQGLVVQ